MVVEVLALKEVCSICQPADLQQGNCKRVRNFHRKEYYNLFKEKDLLYRKMDELISV